MDDDGDDSKDWSIDVDVSEDEGELLSMEMTV